MPPDASEASAAARHTALRPLIVLLSLGAFGSAASMRVADAQLPLLASVFDTSLAGAAQVITVFSIAYGVLQLAYGPIADRSGKWRVISLAMVLAAVASAACAAAPGFSMLLLARAAAGAACAAIIPLAMAWIGDAVPYDRRQPVLARFLTGQILGMALGQLAGGVAADLDLWRLPFALLAAWFMLTAALLWRYRRIALAVAPLAPSTGEAPWRTMAYVLAQPWARVVLLIVFLEATVLFGPLAFLATHLHLAYDVSLSASGSIATFYAVGGMTFALGSRRLLGRLGEAGLARTGGLLLAAGLAAVALSSVWWTAPLACAVAGLGFYMLHNTLQTNATQMAPRARGAAVSMFAACFFLGQTVGVAVVSLLVEAIGTAIVIAAGGVAVAAVGIGFAARLRRRPAES